MTYAAKVFAYKQLVVVARRPNGEAVEGSETRAEFKPVSDGYKSMAVSQVLPFFPITQVRAFPPQAAS